MPVGFLCRLYNPNQIDARIKENRYAATLLASLIADVNTTADWLYFFRTYRDFGENIIIPNDLRITQQIFLAVGTFSWLIVASDGMVLRWIEGSLYYVVKGFLTLLLIPYRLFSGKNTVVRSIGCSSRLDRPYTTKEGNLLAFGIILQDIPQIILTVIIEDILANSSPSNENDCRCNRGISVISAVNMLLSLIDVLHKLADIGDNCGFNICGYCNEKDRLSGLVLLRQTLRGHSHYVYALASLGKNQIVSASGDKTVKLWNVATGTLLKTFDEHHNERVNDVCALGEDGKRIITVSDDRTAKVLDVESGRCIRTLQHPHWVFCVAVAPSGQYFLTGCECGMIRRWDAASYALLANYPTVAFTICCLDDKRFVSAQYKSSMPELWEIEYDTQNTRPSVTFEGHQAGILSVARFDEESFLTGSMDKTIKLWDANDGRCLQTFTGHNDMVFSVSFITGTDTFVSTSRDKTAKVWNIPSGICTFTWVGHLSNVNHAIFLPEERSIASASDDGTIQVWS